MLTEAAAWFNAALGASRWDCTKTGLPALPLFSEAEPGGIGLRGGAS